MIKFLLGLIVAVSITPSVSTAALSPSDRQAIPYENRAASVNSGFENGIAKWVSSPAITLADSTPQAGSKYAQWNSTSAAQTLTLGSIGRPEGNIEVSCAVRVPSGTATHTFSVVESSGSTTVASMSIENSPTWRYQTLIFPSPSAGTLSIVFTSVAADEPSIDIDDCYVGRARGIGSTQLISEWQSYTPTIGLTGGSTTAYGKWRQNGGDVEVSFDATFTTVFTGGTASVSLPSACSAIDTTKLPTGYATGVGLPNSNLRLYDVGTGQWGGSIVYNDTTTVLMRTWTDDVGAGGNHVQIDAVISTTIPFTWANNDRVSGYFKVPCVGWTAQTTASIDAISKRGSAYFSTGSAATTTSGSAVAFNDAAFASPTLEGQALAPTTANDIGIRMTGAPAGVYEVNLVGWLYAYRASVETGTNCVYDLYDGTTSRSSTVAGAPNVSGVSTLDGISALSGTFTLSSAGTINVVLRGQRTSGTGACYAGGPVSISIKNVSQQSPAIVLANSVSTGTANGDKIGRATIANSGSASITSQSTGFLSSVSYVSTGVVDTFFTAGYFSAAPSCTCTARLGGRLCAIDNTTPPSTSGARFWTGLANTAAEANVEFQIICVGPR